MGPAPRSGAGPSPYPGALKEIPAVLCRAFMYPVYITERPVSNVGVSQQ